MHDFENDLKKAASAYIDKAFGTEERAETSSSLEDRVGKLLSRDAHGETVRGKESSFMKRPRKWTALIAAAALVALLGAAVAAGPIIRNFINTRTAQESVVQLDEVPEGWIGVWTVEDLDAVRDDLEASYILMEDLAFTPEDFEDGGRFAGGWKPIGTEKSPFIGTFNGNGHVIHGLYITNEKDSAVEETKNYVGLFGYCRLWTGWDIQYDLDPEYAAVNGFKFFEEVGSGDFVMKNVYIKETNSGYIKNLGIEDSRIVGVYDADSTGDQLFVGPVAGYSEYVINCYTKNVAVEASVTALMEEKSGSSVIAGPFTEPVHYSLSVGGITGGCYMMDCCWADADVTVRADDTDVPTWHIGGLSGYSVSCITSYFMGTVDAGTLPDDDMVCILKNDVPHILSEAVLFEIDNRLSAIDENKANMFRAFYTKKDVNWPNAFYEVAQDLMMQEPEAISVYYVLDPDLKPREYAELSNLIGEAFPDGGFEAYCRDNGVKYGCYYVYDLRSDPDPTFEGFDPDLWNVTPGELPTLKIFG